MKTIKMKSLLLAMLAIFAVSTTMTLTSCSDDDDEVVSIYSQRIISPEIYELIYGSEPMFAPYTPYNSMAYEFKRSGKVVAMLRKIADKKWYIAAESDISVKETSATAGVIEVFDEDGDSQAFYYNIKGKTLTLTGEDGPVIFTYTSGIEPAGNVIIEEDIDDKRQ